MNSKNGSDSRRPYEKPRLRVISLVAEEVLSASCKAYPGDDRSNAPPGLPVNGCGNILCVGASPGAS